MTQNNASGGGVNATLDTAIEFVDKLALLIPSVGGLVSIGINLVQELMQSRNVDPKTAEQARAAIQRLREAAETGAEENRRWLEEHPAE